MKQKTVFSAAMFFLILASFSKAADISTEPYFRIRMDIKAENADAREVINQLQNILVKRGIVITRNKRDPKIEGNVVVSDHEEKKVNPYDTGELTIHEISLSLKGLKIKDITGSVLASYKTFTGFESHEIKDLAFSDAARQIIAQILETDFLHQVLNSARRQDLIIATSAQENEDILRQKIFEVLNDYMSPITEELKVTGKELKSAIRKLAEEMAKQKKSTPEKIHVNSAELQKIIAAYASQPVPEQDMLCELKSEAITLDGSSKNITGIIVKASDLNNFRRMRLQRIYTEDGCLVFGGRRNPDLNPLIYFDSHDSLIHSDFKVEVQKPLMVKALGLTKKGHIIISSTDADRILLADHQLQGKIFSEGRIFVLTGKKKQK